MPTAYITAPPEAAEDLARTLVEERLAACVNRVPCRSCYRWEGEVHDDDEEILLAKTSDAAYDALASRVVEIHPADIPCVERFDERSALDPFDAWIDESVAPGDGDRSG